MDNYYIAVLTGVILIGIYYMYKQQSTNTNTFVNADNNYANGYIPPKIDITKDNELPNVPSKNDITADNEIEDLHEHYDNVIQPSNEWKNMSKYMCSSLDEQYEYPNTLINAHCGKNPAMKERDAINNGISCSNNVDRNIFTDREKQSWCAAAVGEISCDKGFYPTQSSSVKNEIIKPKGPITHKDAYSHIKGDNFGAVTKEKLFADFQ